MEPIKMCFGQFTNSCKCKIDRDRNHFPNNFDCRSYLEVTVFDFKVEDKNKEEEVKK